MVILCCYRDSRKGTTMVPLNALAELREGELCIITVAAKAYEVRWNIREKCFYSLNLESPIQYRIDEVEEWRPASVKF